MAENCLSLPRGTESCDLICNHYRRENKQASAPPYPFTRSSLDHANKSRYVKDCWLNEFSQHIFLVDTVKHKRLSAL